MLVKPLTPTANSHAAITLSYESVFPRFLTESSFYPNSEQQSRAASVAVLVQHLSQYWPSNEFCACNMLLLLFRMASCFYVMKDMEPGICFLLYCYQSLPWINVLFATGTTA